MKLARSVEEAGKLAEQILGMTLVTRQTGPGGRIVRRLLIEEGLDIKRELYLSMLVDRAVEAPVIMSSTAGGMEIEEVAHTNPGADLARGGAASDGSAGVSSEEAGVWVGAEPGVCGCCGTIFAGALPHLSWRLMRRSRRSIR